MSTIMEKLEHLKQILNPPEMNIIDQCTIVSEGLSPGSPFVDDIEGLSIFLGISYNQVYKMKYIHRNISPELREKARVSGYKIHGIYDQVKAEERGTS